MTEYLVIDGAEYQLIGSRQNYSYPIGTKITHDSTDYTVTAIEAVTDTSSAYGQGYVKESKRRYILTAV